MQKESVPFDQTIENDALTENPPNNPISTFLPPADYLNPSSCKLDKSPFSMTARAAQCRSGPQVSMWVLKVYIIPLERAIEHFPRTCSRTAACSRRTTLSSTHTKTAIYPTTTLGRIGHSRKGRRRGASGCLRPHRAPLRPPTRWRRLSASTAPPPASPARPRRAAAAAPR